MEDTEPPEDGPTPDALDDVFQVYETRTDGDRLLYFGQTEAPRDSVLRRLWPEFRDAGYERYEHTRGTGHQLGYGLHGEPLIDEGIHETLEPGMIVNVEPRIAMFDNPDVGAVQLEDTVLITEDGTERLTRTEYDSTLLE
jgi:Xaa-Pro aminopeptidase